MLVSDFTAIEVDFEWDSSKCHYQQSRKSGREVHCKNIIKIKNELAVASFFHNRIYHNTFII